ncbi:MAG: hypothetical protein OEV49_05795 [candidate division Zixibacteria bacterium]|nr:hypothetical protein [candidate division Zixibacteria bacterium]MDH3938403.1 hypothetical protein [candidate division Zixibacteria bacterium]MDH4035407.1 hypothetical protein [candidate division Zixibacteria bacterium]
MTFKLPHPPSAQAGTHELADYAELLCWIRGSTSESEIVADLGRLDDNETNDGCHDDEDKHAEMLDEVMNEIEHRETACGSGYPFTLDSTGTVLKCDCPDPENAQSIVYMYLLLSTRLKMKDNRIHASIDGTYLLETLSAQVLKTYLGQSKARSLVFGTSSQSTFRNKVDNLCQELREGSGFRNPHNTLTYTKDGKLDAVAWVPFADGLPGQLIVFAQCKTGTSWRDSTTQLQPGDFVRLWIEGNVFVTPLKAFCVSEAVDRAKWEEYNTLAGVLLDRCRLVEFSRNIPDETVSEIRTWTLAAKKTTGLD